MHLMNKTLLTAFAALLAACGQSPQQSQNTGVVNNGDGTVTITPAEIDKSCDNAVYPSAEWTACEQANFAKTGEGPAEFANADFQAAFQAQSTRNQLSWSTRAAQDPSWLFPQSGNTALLPLCTTWSSQCVGDPFQYPEATGSTGADFYANEAEVIPVVFYDQDCARISGRVWKPRNVNGPLPGIVIQNGSVQAPETIYWWAAQAFVRAGYLVMTFDPRGQGRSDQQTPEQPPQQGSNANPVVFWEGLVNAIDFFRSSANRPYPHNETCLGTYPTVVVNSNPFIADLDLARLGIAGHSLGGTGVSVVQSYGAEGAEPWPGLMDTENPVDAVVAWDGIFNPDNGQPGNAGGNLTTPGGSQGDTPAVIPQFPIMGQNGEYGLTPAPFTEPPELDALTANFRRWQAANVPAYEFTPQGSTHYDFSPLPTFPTTSWCPNPEQGFCDGGWANAQLRHYSVAWFDRWLKLPGEAGFADADARLLDDDGPQGRNKLSFRYQSARDYPDRDGRRQLCTDIRAGCEITRSE